MVAEQVGRLAQGVVGEGAAFVGVGGIVEVVEYLGEGVAEGLALSGGER